MKKLYLLLIPIFVVLGYILYNARTASTTVTSQEVIQNTPEPIKAPPTPSELLALTNAERQKVGVKPLQLDERLNKSAQWKADDMVKRSYFGHKDPISGTNNGVDYAFTQIECSYISENLTNNIYENTALAAHEAFMLSETHKQAIIDTRYDYVGFGIGDTKVVQHFCDL